MRSTIGLIIIIVSCLTTSCAKHEANTFTGKFSGSDGASHSPKDINVTLAETGDELLTGLWSSEGTVKKGQLIGQLGYFSNTLKMRVLDGECKGEFAGDIEAVGEEIRGTLADNPLCPELKYKFLIKKLK